MDGISTMASCPVFEQAGTKDLKLYSPTIYLPIGGPDDYRITISKGRLREFRDNFQAGL